MNYLVCVLYTSNIFCPLTSRYSGQYRDVHVYDQEWQLVYYIEPLYSGDMYAGGLHIDDRERVYVYTFS